MRLPPKTEWSRGFYSGLQADWPVASLANCKADPAI